MSQPSALPSFSVFATCRQGLTLLIDSAPVLARLAALPLLVLCVNVVAVSQLVAGVAPLQNFIYGLPGIAATGWMVFLALRLWLLGERPDAPVDDRATRQRRLQASIIVYLLWKALMAGYEQALVSIADPATVLSNPDSFEGRTGAQLAIAAMLGIVLWALRFRLAPVLTAVGFSLRDYARRATGFMLSLRLLGLVLLCAEFPKALLLAPLLGTDLPATALMLIGNAVAFVCELWLFAAFTIAVRVMMKGKHP